MKRRNALLRASANDRVVLLGCGVVDVACRWWSTNM